MSSPETSDPNSTPERVGLFGGTFNPVHRGHIQVALDVLQRVDLDKIYIIPSALPPHKSKGKLAPIQDRLAMVRMAIAENPRLEICASEINRAGPSYSIDTVQHCKAMLGPGGRTFFILGVDAFVEIDTWKAFDRLFDETAFVVMSRPGNGQWTTTLRQTVASYVKERIAPDYRLSDAGDTLVHSRKQPIHLLSVTPMDVSSSQIRAAIQKARPIDAWVLPQVAHYIQTRGLYR
jgi:nicotinate-nucleotide adenylyltransferase